MTAQIRPNRMQVNDRFPMLGFAVRTSQPDIQAEVALASAVDLFRSENRARRTAANFYSSREHGLLSVPRGEGVFVVPPEVLARFIGQDKLFFALATGRADQAGLQVDAAPREGSPYVSLTGFTGRTLRRSFAPARADGPPLLEWTGDAAQPGSEPARKAQPAAAGNGRPPAPARPVEYNDGFGELPELPAREARALSGSIGEELELAPAPEPRARAMDGGAAAAIAAASFVIESLVNNQGDVSWEVEQLRGWKHPNDQVPAQRGTVRDGAEIKLDDWPVAGGLVDDISAWFQIAWQYNGQSIGNIEITNIGVNDAVGWGLDVRARIMDDDRAGPGGSAALRITFYYRFTRSIGSDVLAERTVILHGDGSYEISGDWIQASALGAQATTHERPALAAAY